MSEDLFQPAAPAIASAQRAVNIAKRQERAGYAPPKVAVSCRNCLHRCGNVSGAMRCGAWDFPVELGGVCGSWAPQP